MEWNQGIGASLHTTDLPQFARVVREKRTTVARPVHVVARMS